MENERVFAGVIPVAFTHSSIGALFCISITQRSIAPSLPTRANVRLSTPNNTTMSMQESSFFMVREDKKIRTKGFLTRDLFLI
jgi:hypothetical protein